jgi:FKBP-type peptidyl-prolyl cis-trans isomerase 2
MSGKTESEYTPFSVMLGSNQVIPGFENGIMGMKKGEKKTIEVPPEL